MIRNLTPHVLTFVLGDAAVDTAMAKAIADEARSTGRTVVRDNVAAIPSHGVARAKVTTERLAEVEIGDGGWWIPTVRSVYGEPAGLPEPQPGVGLVVAQSARAAGRDVSDLLLTQDMVRDEDGNIIGARALSPFGA